MSQMNVLIPTRERTWAHATRRIPTPEAGQVLIESRFVAVNNADVTGMDRGDTVDEDSVVGYETTGTVVAVGPDLDPGLVGTRVAACTPSAFAQFVGHRQRRRVGRRRRRGRPRSTRPMPRQDRARAPLNRPTTVATTPRRESYVAHH